MHDGVHFSIIERLVKSFPNLAELCLNVSYEYIGFVDFTVYSKSLKKLKIEKRCLFDNLATLSNIPFPALTLAAATFYVHIGRYILQQ